MSSLLLAALLLGLLSPALAPLVAPASHSAWAQATEEVPISPVDLGELGIDITQFDISAIDLGGVTGGLGEAAGGILGSLGGLFGGDGSVVPVIDRFNLVANVKTAGATTGLQVKSIQDAIVTAILKTAIQLIRDMVIRWIVTGRFEGPVFSQSFAIDASRAAENASRVFLSKLTGINFCAGFGPPSIRSFAFDLDLFLTCTLGNTFGGNLDYVDFFFNPTKYDPTDIVLIRAPENDYVSISLNSLRGKADYEARALIAQSAELITGQGFKGIRDEVGRFITPPQIVKALALESIITSPQRQVDVAQTVQQAIAAIIETAVRTIIEGGLSRTFGP